MTKTQAAHVINATVRLDNLGGQGVLVPGGFILTAAHCIQWNGEVGMAMGDRFIESITTKSGARFRVGPCAVEPLSDIAVLDSLDDQVFFDDCEQFAKWQELTRAVQLANTMPPFGIPIPVRILTHNGNWIGAAVTRWGHRRRSAVFSIEAEDRIHGETSGGPVVDSSGRLLGVVSHFTEVAAGEKCNGTFPIAHLALPRWVWLPMKSYPREKGLMSAAFPPDV
jgi:Trypsin-like peptidase domain